MLPCNGIFGITSTRLHHLVECSDTITRFELGDIVADGGDDTGDIVALVGGHVRPLGDFPVELLDRLSSLT